MLLPQGPHFETHWPGPRMRILQKNSLIRHRLPDRLQRLSKYPVVTSSDVSKLTGSGCFSCSDKREGPRAGFHENTGEKARPGSGGGDMFSDKNPRYQQWVRYSCSPFETVLVGI